MVEKDELQRQVDENFEFFLSILPEVIKTRRGKFALLRNREVVEFFDSARDALTFAQAKFADGLFSIQRVVDAPADLGFYSHAVP